MSLFSLRGSPPPAPTHAVPLLLAAPSSRPTACPLQLDTTSRRFTELKQREAAMPRGACKLGFNSMHYSVLEAHGVAT